MTLTIFSFQRAFTASQKMALAAGNCTNALAAIKAKDILDSLYLGLDCEVEVADCGDFCDASSAVDEFIDHCQTLLQKLADPETSHVTIPLSDTHYLSLDETNGCIQMKMDSEQEMVTLPNLTIHALYKNLVKDIQNNADLYGSFLTSYVNKLKHYHETSAVLLHTH